MNIPLLLLAACAGKDAVDSAGPTPTWSEHVAPIVTSRCVGCHAEGGIGPMPLETYAQVSAAADWVADAVVDRRMPPGQPSTECGDFIGDPSLDPEDIETIARWAEGGAPEGDPSLLGELTVGDPEWETLALSRVDLTLEMPEPFTPTEEPDDYRCFLLDWPEEETTYVTGFGMAPGNPEIVHHVIAFVVGASGRAAFEALDAADEGAGYACYGGPGGEGAGQASWLGGWAPGQEGMDGPAGTGIEVEPGSLIILQMHYNLEGVDAQPDQTQALFKLDAEVERPAILQPFADLAWVFGHELDIPAGESGVTHSYSSSWPAPRVLYQVGMHMHELGRSGGLRLRRADGREECVLEIDRWDFNWQIPYILREPITIEPEDELEVSCTFDNPRDEDVNWGDGTSDEMCLGVLYMTEL
ncbi:MAG: hypothetical protein H6740_19465 [Alphaproteobacteria bacterium]|nr:hypothetical protein [Alphaproteobacteria bacterium]